MIDHTRNRKNRAYKSIMALVFSCLLIFGLSFAFLPKIASGVSPRYYYDVISFSGDPVDNSAILSIQVNSTFSIPYRQRPAQYFCFSYQSYDVNANLFTIRDQITGDWTAVIDPYSIRENGVLKYTDTWTCPLDVVFLAGYTYEFKLTKNRSTDGSNLLGVWMRTYYDSNPKGYFYLDVGDYVNKLFENSNIPDLYDYNIYDFLPVPVMGVIYPPDYAEISGAFFIDGSYDAKDLSIYPNLYIWVQHNDHDIYPFVKNFTTITGDLHERISGIPAGEYNIRFIFAGGSGWFEVEDRIYLTIVEDIPYELPITGETTPEVPIFSSLSAQTIYTSYSNYATSTAFFNIITGAIEPIVLTIGDNLTFFSSQFNQTNAKNTGERIGGAILLIRSYTGNINNFFNDLPIAEVLFFYLMTLVVVIVFRLIRLLIKLIPFI